MSADPSRDGLQRDVTIVNRAGMHARPAAEFVKTAGRFSADITVAKDGLEVNGKSIMGVLMLAAEQGSSLRISARGEDALDALDALAELVDGGFQEER
jgi:phosphocarrier protein